MKTLLHVGCGGSDIRNLPFPFQNGDWDEIRYDIDPNAKPDIVGCLQDMSIIEDGSIDSIYSSHNIEHVWAFEVQAVLVEFRRVLRPDGFALILCPDILSVADAITQGYLEEPVYHSPAGPITALDIIYGYHVDIAKGNIFMAHKTAFTSDTLAKHLLSAGFSSVVIARDKMLGLHALAFTCILSKLAATELADSLQPHKDHLIEINSYGSFES
ncbi:MAG: methyltransferase domain-containing protein [Methylotenera sp.]|nr:methyltransferase domain-containing protein [Methylotenera sp.]